MHGREPDRAVNLAEFVHASARRHPRQPAVSDVRSGRSLTYADLALEVERVAEFLTGAGVKRGQRIALLAPNAIAYLPAAFGLLATGACLVPVAANLTPAEVAQIADEVEVNGCLAWPGADALPAVLEGLTSANHNVRLGCLIAVAANGKRAGEAAPKLKKLLAETADPAEQQYAVQALMAVDPDGFRRMIGEDEGRQRVRELVPRAIAAVKKELAEKKGQ